MEENKNYGPDSFYTILRTQLYDNGLFEKQADDVLERVIANDADTSETMKGRWNDRASDYPPIMTAVLWMSVKDEALKWIDEKMPKHWARPMFTRDPEETLRQMKAGKIKGPSPGG